MHQRATEPELLLHAAGEFSRCARRKRRKPQGVHQRFDARAGRTAKQGCEIVDVLADAERSVEIAAKPLRHEGNARLHGGARAFFDQAVNSNRYLLTFLGGGHRIGLGPAPAEMQGRLWDLDWFEDPVWSARRIVGVNLHFITAFLDRYVREDPSRSAYLDGLVTHSSKGEWPAEAAGGYGAYSSGADGITTWKGFQRQHAEGLQMLFRAADQR